jgi:6-phosphofructokinase
MPPGAAALVRAATAALQARGWEVLGLRQGYTPWLRAPRALREGVDWVRLPGPAAHDDAALRALLEVGDRAVGADVDRASDLLDPERTVDLRRALDGLDLLGVSALLSVGDHAALRAAAMLAGLQRSEPRLRVLHIPADPVELAPGSDFSPGFFTVVEALAQELRQLRAAVRAQGSWCVVECPGRSSDLVASCAAAAAEVEGMIGLADLPVAMDGDALLDDLTARVRALIATKAAAGQPFGVLVLAGGVVSRGVWFGEDYADLRLGRPGALAWQVAERVREERPILGGPLMATGRGLAPHAYDLAAAAQLGAGAAQLLTAQRAAVVGLSAALAPRAVPFLELPEVAPFVLATSWSAHGVAPSGDLDGGATEAAPEATGPDREGPDPAEGDPPDDLELAGDAGHAVRSGPGAGQGASNPGGSDPDAASAGPADVCVGYADLPDPAGVRGSDGPPAPDAEEPDEDLDAPMAPGPLAHVDAAALEVALLRAHAPAPAPAAAQGDEAACAAALHKEPGDLTPDEVAAIVRVHHRLLQPATIDLHKPLSLAEAALLLDPRRTGGTAGGRVCDARLTAGWTAAAWVERLGLGAVWPREAQGPFVRVTEAGDLVPGEALAFLELPEVPVAALRVPIAHALIDAVRALARADAAAAAVLPHLTPIARPWPPEPPWSPTGFVLGGALVPRWCLEARRPLPDGARLLRVDAAGQVSLLATWRQSAKRGAWEASGGAP